MPFGSLTRSDVTSKTLPLKTIFELRRLSFVVLGVSVGRGSACFLLVGCLEGIDQQYRTARSGLFRAAKGVWYSPGVVAKKGKATFASVSIVGAGNLGRALALTLPAGGYRVRSIAVRDGSARRRQAAALARRVNAKLVTAGDDVLDSDIVWIAVPDDAIGEVAQQLALTQSWTGKIVFHSSGALTSDELNPLRARGAKVASVHPMMTFVRSSVPQLEGVAFALEGDKGGIREAKTLVARLNATAFMIKKQNKVLYHAFGSFASPLVIALMASLEQVALAAGIRRRDIKPIMVPLLSQTLKNYLEKDAGKALSGPIVRGDADTVRRHLAELERLPEARAVYLALARAGVKLLPGANKAAMSKVLG